MTSRRDARAALIDAAWLELAEHGTAGLSLRAVARRAEVSHAAPKHHFADRAGLLTTLAVEGYRTLTLRLRAAVESEPGTPGDRLGALGRAYLDFSLDEPQMFEVMYGTEPLHADDPELAANRNFVFGLLSLTVTGTDPEEPDDDRPVPAESLMVWSLIHGLVVLTRDGSLQRVTRTRTPGETADLARELTDTFTALLLSTTPVPADRGNPAR